MKGTEFAFDYVHLSYYKGHKIKSKSWWAIYRYFSLDKKNKKATINPINKDANKCLQYVVTVALNHEKKSKNKN